MKFPFKLDLFLELSHYLRVGILMFQWIDTARDTAKQSISDEHSTAQESEVQKTACQAGCDKKLIRVRHEGQTEVEKAENAMAA